MNKTQANLMRKFLTYLTVEKSSSLLTVGNYERDIKSFAEFLLERIMLSIVIAGLSGVDSSILYLSCNKEESQKVFGIYNLLGTIGMLIASFVFSVFARG